MMEQVCEKCRPFVKELARKFREQQKKINELERRLAVYENSHTPYSCKLSKPRPQKCSAKRGKPKGSKGTTRPFPQPTRTEEKKLNACPICSGKLKLLYQKFKIHEELPEPLPIEFVKYIENHYGCDSCGEIVSKPEDMPSRGRFGVRMLAQTTVMKFADRLTFRKLEEAMKRTYGVEIAPASLMGMTRTVSDALASEHAELIVKIRASPCVYADETSMRINGINFWIWIFVAQDAVLVVIRKNRGKKVVKEILGDYQGIVVCDGWVSYRQFGFIIQRCWAHMLREAKDADGKLYKLLHTLFLNAKGGLPRSVAEERLRKIISRGYRKEKTVKLVKKIRNGFDSWFTFLEHNVEPTNNTAEQALREHVVIRKIIGGLRSAAGARTHEIIMSCFATWKLWGLNVFETLLTRLRS